jgi:hypothetical protein
MHLLSQAVARFRRMLRAVSIAVDPGEDDDGQPASTPDPAARVMLTHDDLLWFKTSDDAEGRITLGLLECSPQSMGVLLDDNGESLGLRLSRSEAQDLHRSLVTWLADTARTVIS